MVTQYLTAHLKCQFTVTMNLKYLICFQGPVMSTDPVGRLDELSSPPVLSGGPGVVPICEVPHHPPGIPLPQYNMTDYVVAQHTWPTNIIVSQINQPLEVILFLIIIPSKHKNKYIYNIK